MNPGVTSECEASMRSAAAGTSTVCGAPAPTIVAPSISTRPGENFFSGVKSVPASLTTGQLLLTSASELAHDGSDVSGCGSQLPLGRRAIAARSAHNYCDFQVGP